MSDIIDLRSDLLSRPHPAALAAMAGAASRPAEFELRADPDERMLERRAASVLGKEDALFFPTCTMANLTALLLLGAAGGALVTHGDAHVLTSEAGGASAFAGLVPRTLDGPMPALSEWESAFDEGDAMKPCSSVAVLENTHNRSGGTPLAPNFTRAVVAMAQKRGIRCHLDGARLFNAAVALQVEPRTVADGFATVSISLNKGLGAPLGAMLAGEGDLIGRAVTIRQRLGGGLRPTAVLCAPAVFALENWRDVQRDHDLARLLHAAIKPCSAAVIAEPATNIVMVQLEGRRCPDGFVRALASMGVLALRFGSKAVRLVVSRGLDERAILRAGDIVSAALRSISGETSE